MNFYRWNSFWLRVFSWRSRLRDFSNHEYLGWYVFQTDRWSVIFCSILASYVTRGHKHVLCQIFSASSCDRCSTTVLARVEQTNHLTVNGKVFGWLGLFATEANAPGRFATQLLIIFVQQDRLGVENGRCLALVYRLSRQEIPNLGRCGEKLKKPMQPNLCKPFCFLGNELFGESFSGRWEFVFLRRDGLASCQGACRCAELVFVGQGWGIK